MGKISKEGLSLLVHPQGDSNAEPTKTNKMGQADSAAGTANESTLRPRVEIRKELLKEVRNAADLLDKMKMPNLANQVAELVRSAVREHFTIAFVGEFNHGKSTLINKLLEQDVVPTGELPTTTLLTSICYGNNPEIKILGARNTVSDILPFEKESWKKIVGNGNTDGKQIPKKEGKPRFVSVTLSNSWLKKTGITIIDTPGANDGEKNRDMEISRALMSTDGAVLCIDAQKGLMETQRAFIKDRLLRIHLPYMALVITHLDLVPEEKRDRQVLYIIGSIESMKLKMPVMIANSIPMPSKQFDNVQGIENIKGLLTRWSANAERANRIETWLAANVRLQLEVAHKELLNQKEILERKDESRKQLLTEQKSAVAAMSSRWEELRKKMEEHRNECKDIFNRRYEHEIREIKNAMDWRADTVPDPKIWYEKSYKHEMADRLTAAIISLDNAVTEKARNDFNWLDKEIANQFSVRAERDITKWGNTEEKSPYNHKAAPEMSDIKAAHQKENVKTGTAIAISGVLMGILTCGMGGLLGSAGVGTIMRFLSVRNIDALNEKNRQVLHEYVANDVPNTLAEATADSNRRIDLIYNDILAGAYQVESSWIKTRYSLLEQADKPSNEKLEQIAEEINDKIIEIETRAKNLEKFIH